MKTLFNSYPLDEYFSYRDEMIHKAITSSKGGFDTSIKEITKQYVKQYKIEPPKLKLERKKIDLSTGETPGNTFNSTNRTGINKMYLTIIVTCTIPFKGEEELLYCQPPAYFSQKPYGIVNDQKIYIKVWREYADLNFTHEEIEDAKREIESLILKLKKYIRQIEIYCEDYNKNLPQKITDLLREDVAPSAQTNSS